MASNKKKEKFEDENVINEEEVKNKDPVEMQIQLDELEDKYMRLRAEFENYKKRTEKESTRTYQMAKISLMESILPILDAIEQSKEYTNENDEKTSNDENKDETEDAFKEGLEQVYKQFETFLVKNHVEEIKTEGEQFDPELHEAINTIENSGEEKGTILQEFRKGYKMGNKVIRHSMVVVAS